VFVLIKIKRLSMYSTLHFDLRSALGGAPLDAAKKEIISDNPPTFFHWARLLSWPGPRFLVGWVLQFK
jgi:hypothetical protein